MKTRADIVALCCREDDLAVLREASGREQLVIRALDSPVKLTEHVISHRPIAVLLGVRPETLSHLDVIEVLRAIGLETPVIVIAEEDSLELERRARQKGIFYYLVHPVDREEAEAVLKAATRHVGRP